MTIQGVEYVRSVPRYVAVRSLSGRWPGIASSVFGATRLAAREAQPLPSASWVRVAPILAGVCGSDLATITARGSTYFSPLTSTPFVFGHEVVGRVTEVGSAVDRVSVGDRVCLAPPLHCAVREIDPPCDACRSSDVAHCENTDVGVIGPGIQTGYCRDTGGGWSQSFAAHELQLYHVPDEMSDDAAVLVEPLSCCLHAVEQASLRSDDEVVVLGCGTIGVLTLVALRASGFSGRVLVVAKYESQRRTAQHLDATVVIASGRAMRAELAKALGASLLRPEIGPPTVRGGADAVFDCVGSGSTLDDALRFTRPRGTVIVVGMPGVPAGVDWTAMWHKELRVNGSYTAGEPTFERALEIAARWDDRIAPLVGPRFALPEFREAIRCALEAGRRGYTKVVIEPQDLGPGE